MIVITRKAQLTLAGAADRILDNIACPACGYRDPVLAYRLTAGNQVRFFCDGCGAFVTILFTDAEAEAAPPVTGGSGESLR
jgi:predicted RNA-binding Zn-ribbon protein involved in translation (DUF1610 family)